jgi:hypothetical protein
MISSLVIGINLVIFYWIKYKGTPIDVWKPEIAWTRALIYFSFCNLIIAASGTFQHLFNNPLFTLEQTSNPLWINYLVICFSYVSIAYFFVWPRNTLNFDRKYQLGSQIIFGLMWGFSTGGLLLSFYHLWNLVGLLNWVIYLLSFLSLAIWQYFIHAYFWDIYVSPEHDTPKSILVKTFTCHVPNSLLILGFLTIWNNYGIFLIIFIIALVSSTISQKFPAPWTKGNFHAPMVKPGIFGLPYGSGYEENV